MARHDTLFISSSHKTTKDTKNVKHILYKKYFENKSLELGILNKVSGLDVHVVIGSGIALHFHGHQELCKEEQHVKSYIK